MLKKFGYGSNGNTKERGKRWVAPTLRLLRNCSTVARLALTLLAFWLTPVAGNSQSIVDSTALCNAGDVELVAKTDRPYELSPAMAFYNQACKDLISAKAPRVARQLAILSGDSDFFLSRSSKGEFERYVTFNVKYGNRFAFSASEKTIEYFLKASSENLANRSKYEAINGFLASLSKEARLQVEGALPAEQIIRYLVISNSGAAEFAAYCRERQCKVAALDSDFCAFVDPISLKYQLISDPRRFWARLHNCGLPATSTAAALRVFGVFDGRCSIALQEAFLGEDIDIPALSCLDQFAMPETISSFGDQDVYIFLASRQKDNDEPLYTSEKYSKILKRFTQTWPVIEPLIGTENE